MSHIKNINELITMIERMESHAISTTQLRSRAISHKLYGTGTLEDLILQYEEEAASLREYRMARIQERITAATTPTDTRTVYCPGCESSEYQHILMEARGEGATYAEEQAHLAEHVKLEYCTDCA